MIDYVIEGGADYIVALGTTAETPTLYIQERAVVAMFIANQIRHRVPLVIGVGGNSTSEVLDQLREFDLRGADAILSVTPYYNKPSQEGLYQHFKVVSEHSPLPIILYNIAGRTGVNMTAETTLRIAADFPNVIGIKEASGNIGQIQEIIDRRREGFLVLSGDDGIAVDVMRRGGDGVISVAVNAFPRRFMGVHRPGQEGRFRCGRNGLRPDARSRRSPLRRGKPHRREMRAEHPGADRQPPAPAAGRGVLRRSKRACGS